MKKILKGILLLMMLLCLVACNNNSTNKDTEKDVQKEEDTLSAKEILEKSMEKSSQVADYDYEMNMDYTMSNNGEVVRMLMDTSAQVQDNNLETMKMSMTTNMTMSMEGEEDLTITSTVYYTDGYYYADVYGMKSKMAMNLSELQESLNQSMDINDMNIDAFELSEVKEEADYYTFDFTCDSSKMTDFVQSSLSSMLGELDASMEYDISSISGNYKIDKEYNIVDLEMKLKMALTTNGETIDCDMVYTMKYNNPGEAVTVELPDLSEYQETEY